MKVCEGEKKYEEIDWKQRLENT